MEGLARLFQEDIGKCVAVVTDTIAYAGGDLIILSPTIQAHPVFLGYILNTPKITGQKAQLAQGDAVVHISLEAIKSLEFESPSFSEQAAIAAVLLDMDEEIEKLKAKADKYRQIRLGMMDELLTGRIRLIDAE